MLDEEDGETDSVSHAFDRTSSDGFDAQTPPKAIGESIGSEESIAEKQGASQDDKTREQVRALLLSLANLVTESEADHLQAAAPESANNATANKAATELSEALKKDIYPDDPKPETRTTEMDERMNKYLGLMRSAMKNMGPS